MENIKDNKYFLEKIKEDLIDIQEFTSGLDYDGFLHDEIVKSAVCFKFIQIFENAKQVELNHNEEFNLTIIKLRGFRNRIVHEYGNVDFQKIFLTIKRDVPNFLSVVIKNIK